MNINIPLYFISAASVAGIAVVWRNWLVDHAPWKSFLERSIGMTSKMLTCGSCFTYWLALAFTIAVRPLSSWAPLGSGSLANIDNYFFQWMALAWLAVFLRFLYVALQEHVHYQVHHLNDGHTH